MQTLTDHQTIILLACLSGVLFLLDVFTSANYVKAKDDVQQLLHINEKIVAQHQEALNRVTKLIKEKELMQESIRLKDTLIERLVSEKYQRGLPGSINES